MYLTNSLDFYIPDQFAQKIIDQHAKDPDGLKEQLSEDFIKSIDMTSKLIASKARLNESLKSIPLGSQNDVLNKIRIHDEVLKFIDENRVKPTQFSDVEILKSGSIFHELNELIGDELTAAINYLIASQVVDGRSRSVLSEEFNKHYTEEIDHLKILYQKLQEAGAKCDIDIRSLIENSFSGYFGLSGINSEELIKQLYNSEILAINAYRNFYSKWNNSNPGTCFKILEIYNDELEHAHDLDQIGSEMGINLTKDQLINSNTGIGFFCDPKVPEDEVKRVVDVVKNADTELKNIDPDYNSEKVPLGLRVPLMLLMKDINTRLGSNKVKVLLNKVSTGIAPTDKVNELVRMIVDNNNNPINSPEIIQKARNDYLARKPIFDYEGPGKVHVNFENGEANFAGVGYAARPAEKVFTPDRKAEYAKLGIGKGAQATSNITSKPKTLASAMVEKAHRDNISKGASPVAKSGVRLGFSETKKFNFAPVNLASANFGLVDYKSKWNAPEGLFLKDAKTIAKVLKKSSKSEKQARSRLNFYINRYGLKLKNKVELEKAKIILKKLYAQEVNMSDTKLYAVCKLNDKFIILSTKDNKYINKDLYNVKVIKDNLSINDANAEKTIAERLQIKSIHDKAKYIVYVDNETNEADYMTQDKDNLDRFDKDSKNSKILDKDLTKAEAINLVTKYNTDKKNFKKVNVGKIAITLPIPGAVIGSGYGALTGALLPGSKSRYLVGAGAGALVGGATAAATRGLIAHKRNKALGFSESYKDHLSSSSVTTNFSEKVVESNVDNNKIDTDLNSKLDWIKNN